MKYECVQGLNATTVRCLGLLLSTVMSTNPASESRKGPGSLRNTFIQGSVLAKLRKRKLVGFELLKEFTIRVDVHYGKRAPRVGR